MGASDFVCGATAAYFAVRYPAQGPILAVVLAGFVVGRLAIFLRFWGRGRNRCDVAGIFAGTLATIAAGLFSGGVFLLLIEVTSGRVQLMLEGVAGCQLVLMGYGGMRLFEKGDPWSAHV